MRCNLQESEIYLFPEDLWLSLATSRGHRGATFSIFMDRNLCGVFIPVHVFVRVTV